MGNAFTQSALAKEQAEHEAAQRKPLTFAGVIGAVILGNIATAFIGLALYELLKLLGAIGPGEYADICNQLALFGSPYQASFAVAAL